MRTVFTLFLVLNLSFVTFGHCSEIQKRSFQSKFLNRMWPHRVYVPTGYEEGNSHYPVLYLFHGNGGNEKSWTENGQLQKLIDSYIENGTIKPLLIVMPSAFVSWYVDGEEKKESAIIKELIPWVEKEYRAKPQRSSRLVAGLSAGGFGACRYAFAYPELFCSAGLFAPAIYNPVPPPHSSARKARAFHQPFSAKRWRQLNYTGLFKQYFQQELRVPMFIVSGDDDHFNIEIHSLALYEKLRRKGHPAQLRIIDGGHEWKVYFGGLKMALPWLMSFVD